MLSYIRWFIINSNKSNGLILEKVELLVFINILIRFLVYIFYNMFYKTVPRENIFLKIFSLMCNPICCEFYVDFIGINVFIYIKRQIVIGYHLGVSINLDKKQMQISSKYIFNFFQKKAILGMPINYVVVR